MYSLQASSNPRTLEWLILRVLRPRSHQTRHFILAITVSISSKQQRGARQTSASSISFLPKAARLRSATLNLVAGADMMREFRKVLELSGVLFGELVKQVWGMSGFWKMLRRIGEDNPTSYSEKIKSEKIGQEPMILRTPLLIVPIRSTRSGPTMLTVL
jgi:hypothetical protein